MKKVLNFTVVLLCAGLIFASCNKSTDETSVPAKADKQSSFASIFQTPEGNAELAKIVTKYMEQNPMLKSSEFMMPIFTYDGFGVAKDIVLDCETIPGICMIVSGEIGVFEAEYGPNDFWKVNPDGTISIHLSSNDAVAYHMNFGSFEQSTGENCHLTMNYTGDLASFTYIDPVTGEEITVYYIDTQNSPCAATFQGNGKVQTNGVGKKMNLNAHVTNTPGGPSNAHLKLN